MGSRARFFHFSILPMEEFIQSFKDKIVSRGQRTIAPDSLPTIISGSNAVIGIGQHYQRPRYVSIGPLHRRKPNVKRMEDHKWWLMFVSAFGSLSFDELSLCFVGLKEIEEKCRRAYSVIGDITSDEFVEMLFLDAYFIIIRVMAEREKEPNQRQQPQQQQQQQPKQNLKGKGRKTLLSPSPSTGALPISKHVTESSSPDLYLTHSRNLLPVTERREPETSNPLFNFHELTPKDINIQNQNEIQIRELVTGHQLFNFDELTLKEIDIDLITLDNQIPFFVIEYIWKWLVDTLHMESPVNLVSHLRTYFQVPSYWSVPEKIHHLLHFLHSSIITQPLEKCKKDGRKHWIPSATDLNEAGIRFKYKKSPDSFLDIKFKDGVIKIPTIYVTERQGLRLQNLVDFEQSVLGITTHFTTFVRFMSCLLCKEEDVRIISLQGIIENQLGSDKEVQKFFQRLRQRCGYFHADTFLDGVFIEVNNYRQSKRRRWKASLRRKYCNNPWITLSVVAAVVLFILTFLQTFFTVYSYFHPPS